MTLPYKAHPEVLCTYMIVVTSIFLSNYVWKMMGVLDGIYLHKCIGPISLPIGKCRRLESLAKMALLETFPLLPRQKNMDYEA
jgi:hypothetical protein